MKRKTLLLMLIMALGAPWTAQAQFTGEGTENNPYQISSQDDWHTLATNVNSGISYSGEFFKLTQNISVTEMVGGNASDGHEENKLFSGTFDGDGHTLTFTYTTSEETCAPFRSASGATFKNLRVDGSITTSARYAGGIVGIGRGSTDGITFTNCVSNITITSSYSGDSTHGGFAAILYDGTQHFTGCVFTGSFSGTSSTSWAGFVGYSHSTWGNCHGSAYEKCVFAPTSIQASVPSSCAAFDRNSSGCTYTNCYYTTDYGTNKGTKVYSVTGESPVNVAMRGSATNTYELNNSNCSLKFYSAGLTLTKNGTTTVYGANGNTLNLTLSGASAYSANHGTLAGSGSDYTLVMPSSNVVISEDQGGGSDGTLTVYDGAATSQTVPMYVYYFDDFTRSQFVIPAADLTDMAGGTINSIKFYTKSDNIPYTTDADFDIYVKEVDYTTITALEAKSSATIVYQGKGDFVTEGSDGSITITFSNPFIYNGGNLLIGCDNTTDAGYKNIYFYGKEVAGASTGASNGSSLDQVGFSQQNFIPKTTFTYTPASPCQDFESVTNPATSYSSGIDNMPNGWSIIPTTGNYRPRVVSNEASYTPSGWTGNRLALVAGTSASISDAYAILPSNNNVTGISFNAWRESSYGTLDFGYVTSATDGSTFVSLVSSLNPNPLSSLPVSNSATTSNTAVQINNLSVPSGARLAFKWTYNNSSWYTVHIDNVCVTTGGSTPTYITEIASIDDWNEFCTNVNNGYSYSGKTVTMTANVGTVSTMCGTVSSAGGIASPANCFSGIFDGQGHTLDVSISNSTDQGTAPFRSIYGATIQNLKVTGSVTSTTHGSGLVGFVKAGTDSSTIENCQVSTNVNSTNSHIGGIVGHAKTSTVVLTGCVYDGLLTSTNWKGGLIGWADAATVQLTDCLFNGTVSTNSNFHPIGCKDGSSTVSGTVTNCYYYATNSISSQTADDNNNSIVKSTTGKGKRAYSVTAAEPVTMTMNGTATPNSVSGITGYGTGIEYDDVLYAGDGDQVSLTLNGSNTGYDANYGDLTGSNPYTLGMTANNTIITTPKLHIANTASETAMTWEQFAAKVNAGRTYSDLTVYLDEDITTSTMVGTNANRFKGIFDGQNNTITFNKTITDGSTQYVAPFAYIENATIQNLKVAGTVNSNGKFAGGVVGRAYSSTVINCKNSTTINATQTSAFNASHGGIVGHASGTITITGCVFDGKMIGTSTFYWCGILGYVSNNTTIAINDCFFAPTEVNVSSNAENYTIYRNELSGLNYYNEEGAKMTTKRGTRVYSVTGESPVNVAMGGSPLEGHSYNVSGLNRYSTGITFDQVVYGSENETLSLTLDGANSYEADHGTLTHVSDNNWSLAMGAYDTKISAIACAAPTNLGCITWTETTATLTWDYDDVLGWELQYQVSGSSSDMITIPDLIPTNTYVLTELTTDQNYIFRVRAKCAENTFSEWSGTQDFQPRVKEFYKAGNWNDPNNWSPTGAPNQNEDVVIKANATITANYNGTTYVATANNVTLSNLPSAPGSITIEEGGQLMHNNNDDLEVTIKKDIEGYGSSNAGSNVGYYLFSSPVYDISIDEFDGLLTDSHYDFFKFVSNANYEDGVLEEWVNMSDGGDIDEAMGYIYANEDDTEISITGAVPGSLDDKTYELAYNGDGNRFDGWNLMGNPFVCYAYVSVPDYYVLHTNEDGYDEFFSVSNTQPIAPMSGLMVQATDDDQVITYSRNAPSKGAGILNMDVNKASVRGTTTLDRARVRFGEGRNLEKFQFNTRHTKVYIPEGLKDFAVYYADGAGTIPVNFKAENNGRYTLNFSTEEIGFNYLHLIDNMNGNDVDLLQTPYYTFDAKSTDFASRFTLVFATGNDNDGNFAFFNNGNWIINNDGEATLQVVNALGRVLSSENISGSCSKAINAAAGVYMLRLINNDNVKVQKIVVR